jgi:phosphomannomutase/phosphoglucomutase
MEIFEDQKPLSIDFDENLDKAQISQNGFREYDARWLYPEEINKKGLEIFGYSLGKYISKSKGQGSSVVIGQDYRSYSNEVKYHLTKGLLTSGLKVIDVGLALSPMLYFAQHHLNADSLAMVTASHNENGWTGIKCGIEKSLTFGPDDIQEIKAITEKSHDFLASNNGSYEFKKGIRDAYLKYLKGTQSVKRNLKIVIACGNGTAGAFAPDLLRSLGCEVVELHCNLDFKFPNYNPNPEDLTMLNDLAKNVKDNNADVGFAFDGDGDRLGVVDNEGNEIFADKIGLMLAEYLSEKYSGSKFVIDVKSTGLFFNSEILKKNNCTVDMWKTGHSHIKRRVKEINALCGFEKSGHFFIGKPLGLGFDDGLRSASMMIEYLDHYKNKSMSELYSKLNTSYQSPTMAPFCKDEEKYAVVDEITKRIIQDLDNKIKVADSEIVETNTVNGIRFSLSNGSWGLIRASSNKPSLVIVIESLVSNDEVEMIFKYINTLLDETGKVGEYDQKL